MFVRSLCAMAGLLLAVAAPVLAQGKWVGKTVFIKGGQTIRINGVGPNGKNVSIPLSLIHYRVLMEKGNQIQVHENGVDGWAGKGLFVPSEDAVAYFTTRIKATPTLGWLYGYRAAAHSLVGNDDRAFADLTDAVRLDPRQPAWWSNRALGWLLKKDYDKAIADAEQAIQLAPGSAYGYHRRAVALHGKKAYKPAIADFTRAIELRPNFADYYSRRALAWHALKDYDQAIADVDAALRINPKNVLDLDERGLLWILKKDYDKAITDLSAALKINPRYALALSDRARAWQGKKEYDKAIEDLDQAIAVDPGAAAAYNSLAWLLATCPSAAHRDGKRAVETAMEGCKLTEFKHANDLDTLAAACAEAGQFDDAVRYQEKSLRLGVPAAISDGARQRLELYKNKKAYHAD